VESLNKIINNGDEMRGEEHEQQRKLRTLLNEKFQILVLFFFSFFSARCFSSSFHAAIAFTLNNVNEQEKDEKLL
jgi:hypothetical protein